MAFEQTIPGQHLPFPGVSGNVLTSDGSYWDSMSPTGGASGLSGLSGTGISGLSGLGGVGGASGLSGLTSTSGLSGYSGQSGLSGGISGQSGLSGGGVSGLSGLAGSASASGYSGYSGQSGLSGLSGYSGQSGLSGIGTSGTSGLTGAGTSGLSGLTSTSGLSGLSGYSGQSGLGGFSGQSGLSGFSGYSGQSGLSGFSGQSGLSGFSGQSGLSGTGTSGLSGYSGQSGLSGYSGQSGLSGLTATSGLSGYSGQSGLSGAQGVSGLSGYSGQSGLSGIGTSGLSGLTATSGLSGLTALSGLSGLTATSGLSGLSGTSGYSGYSGYSGQSGLPPSPVTFYYEDDVSDIGGYDQLELNTTQVSESDDSASCIGGGLGSWGSEVLIGSPYASNIDEPGVGLVPAGKWNFSYWAYASSVASDVVLIFHVYQRTVAGAETQLFTATGSDISSVLVGTPFHEDLQYNASAINLNTSDRIVSRVYCKTDSNLAVTVHFLNGGTTHASHVDTPITQVAGISGLSGTSGLSGFSGFSGLSGYSGQSGLSGYSGQSGLSGFSGQSGQSGVSGFSGQSGVSGLTTYASYYFNDGLASDVATYLEFTPNRPTGGFSDDSVTAVGGGSSTFGTTAFVNSYASDLGSPDVNLIPAGTWTVVYWSYVSSSAATNNLVFNGYVRTNAGVESQLFTLTGNNITSTSTASPFHESLATSIAQTSINITDRIVTKVYARTNSNSSVSAHFIASGSAFPSSITSSIVAFGGISGLSGFSGVSGWSGLSGLSGYSGQSGQSGLSGYSGQSGLSGFSGQSGLSGFSGQSGLSGLVGPQGTSGLSGFSGQSGLSGYSGQSGLSGLVGPQGTSGLSGLSGYSGQSGLSGLTATSGLSGLTATSGLSGFSGQSGLSGFSGFSGYSGQSGLSGFSGQSGLSGFNGQSGLSGFSGQSGQSGQSGFSGQSGLSGLSYSSITAISSSYTSVPSDYIIGVVTSASILSVTLTSASAYAATYPIIVKDISGSANAYNVTIYPIGNDLIDGTASRSLNIAYGELTMYSDGSANWYTRSRDYEQPQNFYAPTSPFVGMTYFNTTTGFMNVWNGLAWVQLASMDDLNEIFEDLNNKILELGAMLLMNGIDIPDSITDEL